MKRDEVWERIKEDKTLVYGRPIIDVFLETTEELEKSHWEELTPTQKERAVADLRLKYAATVEEAQRAEKDGAMDFSSTFYNAAVDGHVDILKWLKGKRLALDHNAIIEAVVQGHEEVMDWWIEDGYGFGKRTWRAGVALQGAAKKGDIAMCSRLVQEKGADEFDKALQISAKKGDLKMCKWLVEKGATQLDIPLTMASEMGHLEVCRFLLERGIKDVNAYKHLEFAARGGHLEICKLLDRYGANTWNYAIAQAAIGGHLEVAKWIANKGVKDFNGTLIASAKGGHLDICKWAASKGANDFDGALVAAAEHQHREVCKWAVEMGATKIPAAMRKSKTTEMWDYLKKMMPEKK